MPTIFEQPTTSGVHAVGFESKLGWMTIQFAGEKVTRLKFGYPSEAAMLRAARSDRFELDDHPPASIDDLRQRLVQFAAGEPDSFADVQLSTEHLTLFAARVTAECRKLGWGEVATYAELAARAGRPGAARAVGNVMANNRFPLVVPCHRVVGSGGSLGGYSAPGGLATKRRLLDVEQVS